MKKLLILIIGCISLGAYCAKTKAGKAFVKFANAKTIEQKSKYVLEYVAVLCLKKQKECNEFYNTLAKREANYTLGITLKPQNAPKNYKKETLK